MRIAAGMVKLALCGARVECVVVHDHVVGAALEAKALLVLIRLRRLGRFPVVLLELLAPRADQLVVGLGVDYDLVRVVPVVAAI